MQKPTTKSKNYVNSFCQDFGYQHNHFSLNLILSSSACLLVRFPNFQWVGEPDYLLACTIFAPLAWIGCQSADPNAAKYETQVQIGKMHQNLTHSLHAEIWAVLAWVGCQSADPKCKWWGRQIQKQKIASKSHTVILAPLAWKDVSLPQMVRASASVGMSVCNKWKCNCKYGRNPLWSSQFCLAVRVRVTFNMTMICYLRCGLDGRSRDAKSRWQM